MFLVTDPGVPRLGVVDRVLAVLAAAGVATAVVRRRRAEPGRSTRRARRAALAGLRARRHGRRAGRRRLVDGHGQGHRRCTPPTTACPSGTSATTVRRWRPAVPSIAVPTTAGTGAETNTFGVITDEAAGRKGYIGHPSLLPVATILDPALTVGLPPAATAATGIDAMTHSLESLLSANPNPFAEAMALGGHPDRRGVAAAGRRRRLGPRGPLADADGLAPGRRRPGERHRRGPGPRARARARDARPAAARHGAGRRSCPRCSTSTAAVRDRELALVGVALGVASPTEDDGQRPRAPRSARSDGCARRSASDPTLRTLGFDDADARPRRRGRHRRRGDPQLAAPADAGRGARDPGLGSRLSVGSISGAASPRLPNYYGAVVSRDASLAIGRTRHLRRSVCAQAERPDPSIDRGTSGSQVRPSRPRHRARRAGSPSDERLDGWLADLDGLLDAMAEDHPDLFHDTPRAEIERAIDELKGRTATATDDELMVGVAHIVALVSAQGRSRCPYRALSLEPGQRVPGPQPAAPAVAVSRRDPRGGRARALRGPDRCPDRHDRGPPDRRGTRRAGPADPPRQRRHGQAPDASLPPDAGGPPRARAGG